MGKNPPPFIDEQARAKKQAERAAKRAASGVDASAKSKEKVYKLKDLYGKSHMDLNPLQIIGGTKDLSDRAIALVLASEIDISLENALKYRVADGTTENDIEEIFGERGPLCALGAKIRVAHAFGLIGPITKEDMQK